MQLEVGDVVVYGSHGAGAIQARETKLVLGTQQEVVVLSLAGGLRVELTLEHARRSLRPLASEVDISRVQQALGAAHAVSDETWLKRQKASLAKLNDGDPIGLAHIVRDSAHREAARSARGAKVKLSPWERELAVKARRLLSTEIAYARDLEPEEADRWIGQQLR